MTNHEARDNEREALINRMRRASTAIYVATEAVVADEIPSMLRQAADLLARKHPEPEWEQGWAPHADSREKFSTEEEARNAYYMAARPVHLWKRQAAGPWMPVSDSVSGEGVGP